MTLGQSRPDGGNPDVCRFSSLIAITAALATAPIGPALAWGDEGHRIVALIAQSLLDPAVRTEVTTLLASDPSRLTAHDMANEATWADRLRDANPRGARDQTSRWHFVDIEMTAPDVDQACFNHPVLPTGIWASKGAGQGLHYRQNHAVRGGTCPTCRAVAGAIGGTEVSPSFHW